MVGPFASSGCLFYFANAFKAKLKNRLKIGTAYAR